jgi:hypothetical protein
MIHFFPNLNMPKSDYNRDISSSGSVIPNFVGRGRVCAAFEDCKFVISNVISEFVGHIQRILDFVIYLLPTSMHEMASEEHEFAIRNCKICSSTSHGHVFIVVFFGVRKSAFEKRFFEFKIAFCDCRLYLLSI